MGWATAVAEVFWALADGPPRQTIAAMTAASVIRNTGGQPFILTTPWLVDNGDSFSGLSNFLSFIIINLQTSIRDGRVNLAGSLPGRSEPEGPHGLHRSPHHAECSRAPSNNFCTGFGQVLRIAVVGIRFILACRRCAPFNLHPFFRRNRRKVLQIQPYENGRARTEEDRMQEDRDRKRQSLSTKDQHELDTLRLLMAIEHVFALHHGGCGNNLA